MAKKKEKQAKKTLERTYNVPLRKEWLKVPKYKRAKKAVTALRAFVARHMKSDNVKLGKFVNLEVWKHGIKNPPHHIKVNCVKFDDGKVIAELVGKPIEAEKSKEEKKKAVKKLPKEGLGKPEVSQKEEKPKTAIEKKEESIEKKVEEVKEEKAEQAKEIQKEEIKELKKEHPKAHIPKETVKQPAFKEHRREMIPGR